MGGNRIAKVKWKMDIDGIEELYVVHGTDIAGKPKVWQTESLEEFYHIYTFGRRDFG